VIQPTQGDLLRDLGIARTKGAEDEVWKVLYRIHAAKFFRGVQVGETFVGEDVRRFAIGSGLDEPHSPNVWSAMFRAFIVPHLKAGKVEQTGTQKMALPTSHSRQTLCYIRTEK
jgi:hypothetical protein